MDFATFTLPRGQRYAAVMVPSHSRPLWLRFYRRQTMAVLIEGLESAFGCFGGVPEDLLFDQMRAVVRLDEFERRATCSPMSQKIADALCKTVTGAYLALPNHQNVPSQFREAGTLPSVACDVAFQLRQPVVQIGLRTVGDPTGRVGVLVPETTVDEHDLPPAREHHIGATGKLVPVETVPVTHGMH